MSTETSTASRSTTGESASATMALVMSTFAFTVCFACWVINGVLIAFLVSNKVVSFSTSEIGWLLATPILTGAISRVPLGIMTDIYGGRTIFFILMLLTAIPLYLVSYASEYRHFLLASLGFGLAGGGFAVGIGYVATWFQKEKQGTALGIFGMGNAGAAATTLIAPSLLVWLTNSGADLAQWRVLPQIYAALLALTALGFFIFTRPRVGHTSQHQTLKDRLAPLYSITVWRFGLYYFLVFGAFVAIAQWLVPYSVNVYQISIIQAGLLASLFSLPSGVIRAIGGWLSDKFGARSVMYWVFMSCAISFVALAIPKMVIDSSGRGIVAKDAGEVTEVSENVVRIGNTDFKLISRPKQTPAEMDKGETFLPQVTQWQTPVVNLGQKVKKRELIATGVTNIFYPANLWVFSFFILIIGVATGIGKAGVYKFIPDHFPDNVGAVGGMVGLLGALGGFVLPPVFGWLLEATGLWSSCWIVLAIISIVCLSWMHRVVRQMLAAEAPELSQMIEFRPRTQLSGLVASANSGNNSIEDILKRVPIFDNLSQTELTLLSEIGAYNSIEEGVKLFDEGETGDTAYITLLGKVNIFRTDEGGNEIVLASLGPGEVFGELALIDREPRSASAIATMKSEVFAIARDDFIHLMSTSPRLLNDLMVGMTGRIRQTNQDFFDAMVQQERIRNKGEIDRHRMISQMVTGVAHEINTPIGIATQAASIITDDLSPRRIESLAKDGKAESQLKNVAEAAQLIQDNIVRADTLIKSFKNLSVGQLSETREKINIAELIGELADLYKLKAQESKLTIDTFIELTETECIWDGYPGLFSQIILNLITNADLHAYDIASPGKIHITVTSTEDTFCIIVQDYGCGIPEANLEKIWEPFFTSARGKGGSGLGLSIVRNIVTVSLNGEIRIASEEGKGTTLTIVLPKTAPLDGSFNQ